MMPGLGLSLVIHLRPVAPLVLALALLALVAAAARYRRRAAAGST
jgi:hypothetical protein